MVTVVVRPDSRTQIRRRYVLMLYRVELRLRESGWQESHLRPRGSEPRVLLLNYAQKS